VLLSDGSLVWTRDLKQDYRCESPIWGFCAHPLVVGDTLYCVVGGEGSVAVAFYRLTGKEKWKALSASEPGYCPPSILEAGGKKQLLIWDADKLNGLDPETGKVYWSEKLKPAYGMSIAMPRRVGDLLFASGIGHVGAAFKLDPAKPAVEFAWAGTPKTAFYSANTTPVVDGVLYGVDCDSGELMAVDAQDGRRLWTSSAPTTGRRRAGHGTAFLVRNGDKWYLMSETGDLVIAKLSPQKYEELDRAHLLEPTGESFGRAVVWSHPAFANRCVFARNDKEVVCVSLKR
jgi:outer membrane protein assembly factor BamB